MKKFAILVMMAVVAEDGTALVFACSAACGVAALENFTRRLREFAEALDAGMKAELVSEREKMQ